MGLGQVAGGDRGTNRNTKETSATCTKETLLYNFNPQAAPTTAPPRRRIESRRWRELHANLYNCAQLLGGDAPMTLARRDLPAVR